MKPEAITKAKARLRLAQKTVAEIEGCKSYSAFVDYWYTFLTANKNIYRALNKGAKHSPQSRQWFGAKVQERKSDPLLQYLFQARDDDEHGIDPITTRDPGGFVVGARRPGFSGSMIINRIEVNDGTAHIDVESADGLPVLTEFLPPTVRLNRVYGRGNVPYDPPQTHKGTPLPDQSPITVARLAVAYMSALIDEAEKLA